MNFVEIYNYLNNLPKNLDTLTSNYGLWIYIVIGLILLFETGGVITNFLPGDSLVFTSATLAATSNLIDIKILVPLSLLSSFFGDFLNFNIGRSMGRLYLKKGRLKLISREDFIQARNFIKKRGKKAFIINRFIPLSRVYGVFITGFLQTDYSLIFPYHLLGVIIWNLVYLSIGYYFGNIEYIKNNYFLVILAIIMVSILPALVVLLKNFDKVKNYTKSKLANKTYIEIGSNDGFNEEDSKKKDSIKEEFNKNLF